MSLPDTVSSLSIHNLATSAASERYALPTESQYHLPPSGSGRKVVVGQQGVFFGQSGDISVNKQPPRFDLRRQHYRRRRRGRIRTRERDRGASQSAGAVYGQRSSEFLRRSGVPASKSVAKIRRFAETEGMRNILDRHLCIAQVFDGHLGSQLVEEIAKRSPFVAQLPTKRPHRDAEMRRGVIQARVPSQCREQIGAHFSRNANPVLQSIVQVVAKSENRRISDFVAKLRGAIEPSRVIEESISRLPKGDCASKRLSILLLRFGRFKRHLKP